MKFTILPPRNETVLHVLEKCVHILRGGALHIALSKYLVIHYVFIQY